MPAGAALIGAAVQGFMEDSPFTAIVDGVFGLIGGRQKRKLERDRAKYEINMAELHYADQRDERDFQQELAKLRFLEDANSPAINMTLVLLVFAVLGYFYYKKG